MAESHSQHTEPLRGWRWLCWPLKILQFSGAQATDMDQGHQGRPRNWEWKVGVDLAKQTEGYWREHLFPTFDVPFHAEDMFLQPSWLLPWWACLGQGSRHVQLGPFPARAEWPGRVTRAGIRVRSHGCPWLLWLGCPFTSGFIIRKSFVVYLSLILLYQPFQ